MLDKLTRRVVDSFHRSAKETIIPVKEVLKKNVNTQMDIGGKILKLGTMLLIFFGILKISSGDSRRPAPEVPSTIIINNYIGEKEGEKVG